MNYYEYSYLNIQVVNSKYQPKAVSYIECVMLMPFLARYLPLLFVNTPNTLVKLLTTSYMSYVAISYTCHITHLACVRALI